jgi:hypothetical protein
VLLDADNGPAAFTGLDNARLYDDRGLAARAAKTRGAAVCLADDRKSSSACAMADSSSKWSARGRAKKGGPATLSFWVTSHMTL